MLRGVATGRTSVDDLRAALRRQGGDAPGEGPLLGQAIRFAAVGVACALAYLLLYVLMRGHIGAQAANAVSLLLTAIANTAANRRWTFAIVGRPRQLIHHGQALAVFALALALTSAALALLHTVTAAPSRVVELAVLVAANLTATLWRFLLLRHWVFGAYQEQPHPEGSGGP